MRARLVGLGLLIIACSGQAPDPAPPSSGKETAKEAKAPPADAAETCVLGEFAVVIQQRMIQDDGLSALLEDQSIGKVPVAFAAQEQALAARPREPGARGPAVPQPRPGPLMLARGAMVTRELEDIGYVPHPDGAKPTETRTERRSFTFFLADAAWDCSAVAGELGALPRGEVGAAACVPAPLRARCTPLAEVSGGP